MNTSNSRIVGMDCEMVGVGQNGVGSILARVSIVNYFGDILYDTFVAPQETVTDYRTDVSGVRPEDLVGAPSIKEVKKRVSALLQGNILVGHGLKHDVGVLFLNHPKRMRRDTSEYKPFR
jgi:RNA exonuclease 4